MNKYTRMLGMILALNFETLAIFMGCWYLGQWLDENYPVSFKWQFAMFFVSLAAIVFSWVNFVRVIKRMNKDNEEKNNI